MSDIAVNSRLLGLSEVNVHVEDTGGDGRPVVLIHGWPLTADSWSEQIPVLQGGGYRVIAYDRRGFGRSDKPGSGYDYDTLAADLKGLIDEHELNDVTLVGFSMGGGEVARYIAKYGEDKLHSVVFAAAVPPMMLKTDDNPDGPLTEDMANEMKAGLQDDRDAFFDQFTKDFFSANGTLKVSEAQRQLAVEQAKLADMTAALACMESFGTTDFREDLKKITVPTLVIHGDSDGTVPFEGSGERTHDAIEHSELHLVKDGPHGINVSHADEFNQVLTDFLKA